MLQRGQTVDETEADVAHEPKQVRLVGEQPVEPVGRNSHGHGVEPPPALIALEHGKRAGIKPEPDRIDDHLGERGDILEPHIEPLPRDRMDDVGGIAHEREAIGDERARHRQAERMDAARADRGDLAETETEAPLELGVKFRIGQRDEARRLLRLLGPHDRRTVAHGGIAGQRQDCKRPGGKKMLLGAPVMVALVGDGGDDGGLAVAPAVAGDPGALADRRMRAIGGDQKPRGERLAIGQAHIGVVARKREISDGRRPQRHTFVLRLRRQRSEQRAILDHVGERLARLHIAIEAQKHRPHDVGEAAIGHHHIEDGLRLDVPPNADGLEQAPRRGDDGGGTCVLWRACQRGVGDRDRERRRKALAQRNRQRETGKARAPDQHVDLLRILRR